jgi:hypothetical protein
MEGIEVHQSSAMDSHRLSTMDTDLDRATTVLEECVYKQVYAGVFYIYTCALAPMALLGIILNIINLVVLRNMQNTSHTSVFLLRILAACDIFFLIICILFFFVRHMVVYYTSQIEIFARPDYLIGQEIFYATIPFYHISVQTRNWLVVLITFERFLNIVFPLWARRHCTKRSFGKISAAIACVAVLINAPVFLAHTTTYRTNPCTGLPELHFVGPSWGGTFSKLVYVIFILFTPLFLIYIMNIFLINALRRARSQRNKMAQDRNKSEKGQVQATAMVISVVVVFTICETPTSMDMLAALAGIKFGGDSVFENYSRKTGLLLIITDSSLNFVAYCLSNRTFRQNISKIFNCSKDLAQSRSNARP